METSGPVRWTVVGGANCCYEMMHIASLSSRGTCVNFSFPTAGNKGWRDRFMTDIAAIGLTELAMKAWVYVHVWLLYMYVHDIRN